MGLFNVGRWYGCFSFDRILFYGIGMRNEDWGINPTRSEM